ncbi:uncharacterized protein LOC144447521 [Glandiceps talaboti]
MNPTTPRVPVVLVLTLAMMPVLVSAICQEKGVHLNPTQIRKIKTEFNTIEMLERNPEMLLDYQEPIVELTTTQQAIISKQRQTTFKKVDDLPQTDYIVTVDDSNTRSGQQLITKPPVKPTDRHLAPRYKVGRFFSKIFANEGTTTAAPLWPRANNHNHRMIMSEEIFPRSWRASSSNSARVCEATTGLKALVLALNSTGHLVQLVQFPEKDQRQWIFQEKCVRNVCTGVTGSCSCEEELSEVNALVIDLRTGQLVDTWINAHSQCLAKLKF